MLEGANLDHHLQHETDYCEFSKDSNMQNQLKELLWQIRERFKGIGCIKGVKHRIILQENARPICQPLCRRSPKEKDVERESMQKLPEAGVLEPSNSPWASNNAFVRKEDGSIRVTADFRALNDATVTDSYPLEDMRQEVDWLDRKIMYSKVDLKDAFY